MIVCIPDRRPSPYTTDPLIIIAVRFRRLLSLLGRVVARSPVHHLKHVALHHNCQGVSGSHLSQPLNSNHQDIPRWNRHNVWYLHSPVPFSAHRTLHVVAILLLWFQGRTSQPNGSESVSITTLQERPCPENFDRWTHIRVESRQCVTCMTILGGKLEASAQQTIGIPISHCLSSPFTS
jgi:hypothetical protein